MTLRTVFTATIFVLGAAARLLADEPTPPEGFHAIFNGRDLAGWYGLNPHSVGKLEGEKREANLKQQRDDFAKHWRVENGELVNSGTGPYATTEKEYGDIELLDRIQDRAQGRQRHLPPRHAAGADLGHQPAQPCPSGPTAIPTAARAGSSTTRRNRRAAIPLVVADKPFGEWNAFRIRQIGPRTWVWLNDKLVVEDAVMENFWDRTQPLPAKGPIMLQTHGGEIRWRNLFVREIGADEAAKIPPLGRP